MPGAAVLAGELAGLPWSAIDLPKLKRHAHGNNASKARGGGRREGDVGLKDGKADARWIAGRPASQSSSLQGFTRNLGRQGRVNAGIRLLNSSTSRWPVIPTAAIMARAMNP